MSEHVATVLETVNMHDLLDRFGDTVTNEDRRLAFWIRELVGMLPNPTVRLIAQTALEEVQQ
jgi:hypothetical protein